MKNFQGKVIYSFDLFDFLISYHYFVKKKKKIRVTGRYSK